MKLRLLISILFAAFAFSAFSQGVGLIGTATPDDWASDVDMVRDAADSTVWTLEIVLKKGEAKFRLDDDWAVNWGDKTFPGGTGTAGGPNVPIPFAGRYVVTFNSGTGAYNFAGKSDVGVIGTATPGLWASDTDLVQDPDSTHLYNYRMNLTAGDIKFRQDDDWAANWGAPDFPAGIGIAGGPNIPVAPGGVYNISFNKTTGAYKFEELVDFVGIGVIGTATPGGWDFDTDLVKDGANPNVWKAILDLKAGEIKFRANDAWTLSWGGQDFPTDTGVINGPNIIVPDSGAYLVIFNTQTFIYKFFPVGNFTSVGIIGNATPGGWGADTDMNQDAADKSIWRLRVILTDGEAKFRADNDWAVNWGAGDFPSGVAEQDGANIPVPAGEYKVTFNSTTGEYSFEALVVFGTIGLVGPATPLASWDTDFDMTRDATDESFWFIPTVDLVDGYAKFRAEDAWAVNWGLDVWPSGTGKQDGPNIPVTGGTYRVTLNSATGDYAFGDPQGSATSDLLRSDAIQFAPNPAADVLNISVKADELRGDAHVIIFNSLGERVISQNLHLAGTARVDVSGLPSGTYLVHVSNGKFIVGKQVTIVK